MKKRTIVKRVFLSLSFIILLCNSLWAQDSSDRKSVISWSGFLEAYYSYDFAKPSNHLKPSFFYNYNRHNEFTINLALVSVAYNDSNTRGNLALMAGTYPQYNLAAEPELLRHVYEANVGIKVLRKKEVWVDAGIFPSHLGFESAIGASNWTLTRSISAENSPYYEAGIKVSYKTGNKKWYAAALLLNGWQRIKRINGNNTPAFGTQITVTPSNKIVFNSSTFIGSDKPDSIKQWRYFHNLYAIWQVSKRWGITAGFDVGGEQKELKSSALNVWYTPIIILRYQVNDWSVGARAEYYNDPKGVIVPAVHSSPFKMQGYSLNVDRHLYKRVLWRVEGRWLKNRTGYFNTQSSISSRNLFFTMSLSALFN